MARGDESVRGGDVVIPSGDTTVRGYAFESLGVQQGDATVPGRYYAVFNTEVTHWIREAWGIAAFVDAGNAVDSLSDAHLALGYGVGLRVRSPLGPFRVDLAYGQDVLRVTAGQCCRTTGTFDGATSTAVANLQRLGKITDEWYQNGAHRLPVIGKRTWGFIDYLGATWRPT